MVSRNQPRGGRGSNQYSTRGSSKQQDAASAEGMVRRISDARDMTIPTAPSSSNEGIKQSIESDSSRMKDLIEGAKRSASGRGRIFEEINLIRNRMSVNRIAELGI